MVLVDASGIVVDVFGVPGEDGSGTNHDFENGRVLREIEVVHGNSVYDASEWIISAPQNAPGDFSPGVRN